MNPIMYMFLYATKIIEYAILGEHSWFEHCKVYNLDFFLLFARFEFNWPLVIW
jgi:hypothetical protein